MNPDTRTAVLAALAAYGASLGENDYIVRADGHPTRVRLEVKKGRLRAIGGASTLASYPVARAEVGVVDFVEKFWFWTKKGPTA